MPETQVSGSSPWVGQLHADRSSSTGVDRSLTPRIGWQSPAFPAPKAKRPDGPRKARQIAVTRVRELSQPKRVPVSLPYRCGSHGTSIDQSNGAHFMSYHIPLPIADSLIVTGCSQQAQDLEGCGLYVLLARRGLFGISDIELNQCREKSVVIVPPLDAAKSADAESAFALINDVAFRTSFLEATDLVDKSHWNARPTPTWAQDASYLANSHFPAIVPCNSALMPLDMLGPNLERPGPASAFVTRGEVTLLSGADPNARTEFGLSLAFHVAAGVCIANQPVVQGNSVFVSLDQSSAQLAEQFRRIVYDAELDMECVLRRFRAATCLQWNPDDSDVEETHFRNFRFLGAAKKHFVGADLVVIDGAQLALEGDDNRSYRVATFVQALKAIASETSAAVLLLCREGRNGAKVGQGTVDPTAWTDAVRSHISLQDEGRGLILTRATPRLGGSRILAEIFEDSEGRLVILPPGALQDEVNFEDETAVLNALADAAKLGFPVPTSTTGPKTAWHILQQFDSLGPELRNVASKSRVHSALARLALNERIFQSPDLSQPKGKAKQWEIW